MIDQRLSFHLIFLKNVSFFGFYISRTLRKYFRFEGFCIESVDDLNNKDVANVEVIEE
jgi:hypothetical protein